MTNRKLGLCERLARDESGNVMPLIAAAVLPLMVAVGGGVDLTRAYMAEARLAQTCDAAALAGRKVMTRMKQGEDQGYVAAYDADGDGHGVDQTGYDEVRRFVEYNFPEGMFGTSALNWEVDSSPGGTVSLAMSTAVPSTISKLAGKESFPVSVDCSATQEGINVDVVLVLDVTGSMDWDISGSSKSRIEVLRDSVENFMGQIEQLRQDISDDGLRVRVGVVPYNTTVNIGRHIFRLNNSWIDVSSDDTQYLFENYDDTEPLNVQYEGLAIPVTRRGDCVRYLTIGPYVTGFCLEYATVEEEEIVWGYKGGNAAKRNDSNPVLRINPELFGFVAAGADGGANPIPLRDEDANLVDEDGNPVTTWYFDERNPYAWRGCLEMRSTVRGLGASSDLTAVYDVNQTAPSETVPGWQPYFNVFDDDNDNEWGPPTTSQLDPSETGNASWSQTKSFSWESHRLPWFYRINNGGTTNSTFQWEWEYTDYPRVRTVSDHSDDPYEASDGNDTDIISRNGPNKGCPDAVARLSNYTWEDLSGYIDNLETNGGTYHNVGMYWGIMLLKGGPGNLFGNEDEYNGRNVKRVLVFMSDGELSPTDSYTSYGRELVGTTARNNHTVDVDSSGAAQKSAHRMRFNLLCQLAKQEEGIEVNTIAFSSDLGETDLNAMRNCASSQDKFFQATTAVALEQAFDEIGRNLGYLRVSK